jgi:hypothetical protein
MPKQSAARSSERVAPRSRAGAAPPPSLDVPAAESTALATRLLFFSLVILAACRGLVSLLDNMYIWSLNPPRFLPGVVGWIGWAIAALALLPAIGRRADPALARAGEACARGVLGPTVAAMLAALLVWMIPDRLHFVGDFIVRLGAARENISATTLFPQAMPLDLFLHHTLPQVMAGAMHVDPLDAERIVGAFEAAILALLAVAFARALELHGAAALVTVAATALGGWLALFTGYGKAFRELSVVVLAVAAFGVRLVRSGRGIVPLGLAVAVGLALHRSGVGLLPAYAVALALAFRRHGETLARRPFATGLGIAIPAVTLALATPKIFGVIRAADALHFAPAGGGWAQALAAAIAPAHLREIANSVLVMSPLAMPALVAAFAKPRATRDGTSVVLLALAIPFLVAMILIHPRQGSFRDWDDFAPTAVAIGALAAAVIAHRIAGPPARPTSRPTHRNTLALAVTLAALVPTVQWMWLEHDLHAGLARVHAYLSEPPARAEADRTLAWDYLGTRLAWADSLDASADAYAHAAEITPTPRLLYTWAKAEAQREHYTESRAILERLTARADTWAGAWGALAFVSQQLRDTVAARMAAARALALDPNDPLARDVIHDLGNGPATPARP